MREKFKNLSLNYIISIPLVLAIILIALLSYVLFYWSFIDYTREHMSRRVDEIETTIASYFEGTTKYMTQLMNYSGELSKKGLLDTNDSTAIEEYLLTSLNNIDVIDGMFYYNDETLTEVSMVRKGRLYEVTFNSNELNEYRKYEIDDEGRYLNRLDQWETTMTSPNWYKKVGNSVAFQEVSSSIGMKEGYPPGIVASKLNQTNDGFFGAFAAVVSYETISSVISGIAEKNDVIIYLVDNRQNLVASSIETPMYLVDDDEYIRVKDFESDNESIVSIAEMRELGLKEEMRFEIEVEGVEYFFVDDTMKIAPLDYRVIIGVSKENIYNSISRFNERFLVILLVIGVVSIVLVKLSIKVISEPLIVLNTVMKDMKNVEIGKEQITDRTDVIGDLIKTYNSMSLSNYMLISRLKNKQEELKALNITLEKRVKKRTEELEKISITDEMTKVYNRRFLVEVIANQIKISSRYDYDVSVIIIDIDFFKKFNDEFGHIEGDHVLKDFAGYLSDNVRDATIVGRYGGEEFLLVLPNTDLKGAKVLADRLLKGLAVERFGERQNIITASFGVASLRTGDTIDTLIHRADLALYSAKTFGRNNVKTEDELQNNEN